MGSSPVCSANKRKNPMAYKEPQSNVRIPSSLYEQIKKLEIEGKRTAAKKVVYLLIKAVENEGKL
jgi:hypothetical protein